ncbi:MAG: avidin/streptavidin family protein [Endozoicomonas sp.]
MKLIRPGFLFLSFLFIAFACLQAAPPDKQAPDKQAPEPKGKTVPGKNLTGFWQNQRGSTLEIIREGPDHLKGHFTTAVANTRACIGHPVPFRGANNGNALSISMSLESCGSPTVIAMSGIVMEKDGKEQLKTQALIQYKGVETWNSQILTTDFYTRVESAPPPKKAKP